MSRNPRTHPSPRARPVAEAPIGALLDRADELASAWAIALIRARPLERIGEIPLDALARDAPALCAQTMRALESDAELERMVGRDAMHGRGESASAPKLAALAGAADAESTVDAVEALRGVLWEALLGELRDPPARQVADLADRLAYVCAAALAAAVAAGAEDAAAGAAAGAPAAAAGAGDSGAPAGDRHRSPVGPRGAVLIDEREDAPAPPGAPVDPAAPGAAGDSAPPPPAAPADPAPSSPRVEQTYGRPRPWDLAPSESGRPSPAAAEAPPRDVAPSAQPAAAGARAPQDGYAPQIEVRDERREEGPAAWIGAIGHELEHSERDRLPFAVLLVEVGDTERLRRAALPGGVSSLTDRIEYALAQELRRIGGPAAERGDRLGGTLTRERPGRYWLLAPATDAAAARHLAEWLVRTIEPLATRRWAPLEVKIGTAMCPEDGREASVLAAHAEMRLDGGRAAGRPVAPVDEPA